MTFEQWFAKRYPKLAEAAEFGMMGPNEVWLFNATKEAFHAGEQCERDNAAANAEVCEGRSEPEGTPPSSPTLPDPQRGDTEQ